MRIKISLEKAENNIQCKAVNEKIIDETYWGKEYESDCFRWRYRRPYLSALAIAERIMEDIPGSEVLYIGCDNGLKTALYRPQTFRLRQFQPKGCLVN